MCKYGGKCGKGVREKAAPYNAAAAGGIIAGGSMDLEAILIFSISASCNLFAFALRFYNICIYILFLILLPYFTFAVYISL